MVPRDTNRIISVLVQWRLLTAAISGLDYLDKLRLNFQR
uniref:Uncharacterized protein n=1 Tax=Anguilla anguilla TaxID=7936 RepID=A0A0E9UPI9_ANGAN